MVYLNFRRNFKKHLINLSLPTILLIFKIVTLKLATDDSRKVRKTQKTCETWETSRKKGALDITQKLTTHFSRFDYFLVQLNFIPYRTKKSLCLVHDYRFYHKTVPNARHKKFVMKQHKQHKITYTHVSHLAYFLRLMDFSRIVCSRLKITLSMFQLIL